MAKYQQKYIIPTIVFAVAVFNYAGLSSASSSAQKQQKFPSARINGLPTQWDPLLTKLEEENYLHPSSECEKKVAQMLVKQNERLDALQAEIEAKINVLMAKSAQPKKETRLVINRKHEHSESHADENNIKVNKDLKKRFECRSAPRKLPPSSCRQLSFFGHYLDGIYLIANPDTSKIETVNCDFGTNPSETLYGSLALKTKSVHFYVQRSSNFASNNAVIPFDIERLNEGGAMNLAAGVFTVPVNGIYHFDFSGLKDNSAPDILIYLQVNGANIGISFATGLHNYLALSSISASLRLKVGDKVRLYQLRGTLFDSDADSYTHFTGWLVEEDFVLC